MLPPGAVHVPCRLSSLLLAVASAHLSSVKGTAKIAKELGFDYAEAVVCFVASSDHAAV